MPNRPTADELLEAVRDFIEQRALPDLRGRNAFHARVAVNAIDIVRREIEGGGTAVAKERARLLGLLGANGAHLSTEQLSRELCHRIRAGEIGLATAGLAQHLWQTTLERLAIDQPKYATYRKHVARSSTD